MEAFSMKDDDFGDMFLPRKDNINCDMAPSEMPVTEIEVK